MRSGPKRHPKHDATRSRSLRHAGRTSRTREGLRPPRPVDLFARGVDPGHGRRHAHSPVLAGIPPSSHFPNDSRPRSDTNFGGGDLDDIAKRLAGLVRDAGAHDRAGRESSERDPSGLAVLPRSVVCESVLTRLGTPVEAAFPCSGHSPRKRDQAHSRRRRRPPARRRTAGSRRRRIVRGRAAPPRNRSLAKCAPTVII